ncbi:MAG: surfeit locus 1 family protein [Paracoccaceae bacterium]|jgi:surfeit locus 1 family protein
MRRLIFPIVLGLSGIAVLLYLGFWQVDRLAWKQGVLAEIDARIAAAPIPLRVDVDEASDKYRAVSLSGTPTGAELHVLVSGTAAGTGYRVISGFDTDDGRRILLDQGLLALEDKSLAPATSAITITGNLIWPDDRNSSTPDPDLPKNIWFARDITAMAAALGTDPIMVVLNNGSGLDPRLTPLPVDTSTIKNDHLNYAITWFLLAFVWAVMTMFLITRTLRQKD